MPSNLIAKVVKKHECKVYRKISAYFKAYSGLIIGKVQIKISGR